MIRIGGSLLGFALALALTSAAAEAQVVNGRWQLSPQSGSSKGIAREPAPTVFVVTPSPFFHQPLFPRRPVAFTVLPAILMSDGSVFADFGFGFEPVVRPCASIVLASTSMQVVGSNGIVLSQGPATHIPPVPRMDTPSQQNLSSAQSRNVVISTAAQAACFSRDAAGRVFVHPF
jgi:hypothetical protein